MTKWREILKPITKRSNAKPKQMRNTVDTSEKRSWCLQTILIYWVRDMAAILSRGGVCILRKAGFLIIQVRTHESDSEVTVTRLGRIVQRISLAQSGAIIHRAVWKWSGETSFLVAIATILQNFGRYDFCPVYIALPRLTAPGSARMDACTPHGCCLLPLHVSS